MLDEVTLTIMKAIAPPFMRLGQINTDYSKQYYLFARLNAIPLTYLESLSFHIKRSLPVYRYHTLHLRKLIRTTLQASSALERIDADYVIIKTLRPYPEDTIDIDILNLGSTGDYAKMIETLVKEGYKVVNKGPYIMGLRSREGIELDIYNELNVNWIIYVDKRKLRPYVKHIRLQSGYTKVLAHEADLLVLIAHSTIKESYTLGCLLTTLHYIYNSCEDFINKFVLLVKENSLTVAARWYLTLSTLLCKEGYGIIPESLIKILSALGGLYHEAYKTFKTKRSPPYACSPSALLDIIREKLNDPVFKWSFCKCLINLPGAVFTRTRALINKIYSISGASY